jgi:predicted NACHT family NTPase
MKMNIQIYEIINKMVEIKQSGSGNELRDFNRYCNSITIDEWKALKDFGEGLMKLSDVHIKHSIRLII